MMKKQFFFLIGLLLSTNLFYAQNASYFYSTTGENRLGSNTTFAFVELAPGATRNDLKRYLKGSAEITRFATDEVYKTLSIFDRGSANHPWSWAEIRRPHALSTLAYERWLEELAQEDFIATVSPYYTLNDSPVGVSNYFYVKLKQEEDLPLLLDYAQKQNVLVAGQNAFMPLWYMVRVTKQSRSNSLELANQFYESKFFAAAHPDFLVDVLTQCATDPLFDEQWNLENTGQGAGTPGVDINICGAHTLGSSNVKVAVLDQGIQLNHSDLELNISALSYNCQTGSSPSRIYGTHGTNCAGIIGARQNNGIGVSSVAPLGQLMSVSHSLYLTTGVTGQLADGINWSWQNGADVISNSWAHATFDVAILEDAIQNALDNGRDGKGTIMCFATGNYDGSILPPANMQDEIIAVGAMSPCGERKNPASCDGETSWGSNYGNELDVVAPGVDISTTTLGSRYIDYFNGTSSACPQVAGIAALIIDQNPCLTEAQVRDIIERSTQKIGSYNYANTSGRPNGTWNEEMGYGLVDAEMATYAALPYILGPPSIPCQANYSIQSIPGATSYFWSWTGSSNIVLSSSETNIVSLTNIGGGSGQLCVTPQNGESGCARRCRNLSTLSDCSEQEPPFDLAVESEWFDLDVGDAEEKGRIDVFPNPANDLLNINFETSEALVELVAFDGRLVKTALGGNGYLQLDLSEVRGGVYLLRVIQPNGQIHSEKVMKF